MTEANNSGNGAWGNEPGPRRSTYTPPTEDADIPLTLGEETPASEPTPAPPVTPTPPPVSTTPPVSPVAAPPPATPVVPAAGLPANVPPPPPRRTSMSDQQIMEQMGHGGNTVELIGALQDQMALREKEDEEFDAWATLIRQSLDEETAEAAIEAGRREFDGLPPAPPQAQPVAVEPEPEPVAPADVPADVPVVSRPEQVATDDIVLPRFGQPVAEQTDAPRAEPLVAEEPAAPAEPSEFERVLVDPDAVSPPTEAWPLVPEQQAPVVEQPEQHTDEVQAVIVEEVVEAEVSVTSTDSGEQVETTVSVREFLATKETRQVPFEDTEVTIVPSGRFGFDHVGDEPTPGNVRIDRALQLFWAWWAVGSPIVGLLLGAWLIESGLNLSQAILAAVGGVLLASIPVVVGTLKGVRTGLPTLISARASYGLAGNIVPSIVMLIVRIAVAAFALWGASWMVTGILVESNYWNGEEAIITVVVAAIVVLASVTLAVAGRGFVHVTLWVTATLATLGLIGMVLITLEPVSGQAFDLPAAGAGTVIAGIGVVMSVFLVVWAHFGADLSRFQDPWSPKASTSLAALGALIPPLLLLSWGALLGASNDEFRQGMFADFFDTTMPLAPVWYPIPAVLLLALPLIGLASLSLHSSGYALMSVGVKMPRYVAVTVASALAAIAAIGVIVFVPNVTGYLLDHTLVAGVTVAAWVGGYTGEVLTRRVYLDPRLLTGQAGDFPRWRVAPVLGFVAAIAIGLGFLDLSVSWLSWTGYLANPLAQNTAVDLTSWQLGPLIALLLSLVVSLLAGIRGGVSIERSRAAG